MAVCFPNFAFYEISTPVMRTMVTTENVVQIIISDIYHTLFIKFKVFWNFSKLQFFCTFWRLRSFHSDDAHHGNYGERCSNLHFRSWAHILYHIYSVLKIIEISVCFAHFGFYEVSTPVMRTMVSMVNVVQVIISDVEHTLYMSFTAFWNFSKLQFVLHILTFTKFLLLWYAPC